MSGKGLHVGTCLESPEGAVRSSHEDDMVMAFCKIHAPLMAAYIPGKNICIFEIRLYPI